jgi:uncharacterized membrane protein YfcA
MDIAVISLASFIVAILTFFSGFGLGTILTPVFMIFFPVDLAIALTGVVHLFNNIFKVVMVGKKANVPVLIRFGIPAVIASFAGALLLLKLTGMNPLFSYSIGERTFDVYPVKFIIAILLTVFVFIELVPYFNKLQFSKNKLPIGGALSGFFGGLAGVQGALRSAFLIRAGLTKEVFIATAVVVSCFVDLTRLSVYVSRFAKSGLEENINLVICATLAGIAGSYLGNKLLKKITFESIKIIVAVMLIMTSIALGVGII